MAIWDNPLMGQLEDSEALEVMEMVRKAYEAKDVFLSVKLVNQCPRDATSMKYFEKKYGISSLLLSSKNEAPAILRQIQGFITQKTNYWDTLDDILSRPACRKVLKRTKLRARYLAYLYQVMAYTDYTFALRDTVADEIGLPPYEEWTESDVIDSPWMIPMSGSLAVDSEANYVCNWAIKSMGVDDTLRAVRTLHEAIAALLTASLTSLFRIPAIIPAEPEELTESAVCEYLLNFATPKQTNAERYAVDDEDARLPAMTNSGIERLVRDRTMFAAPGVGVCLKKPYKPVIQAEGADILDENLFRGIRITEILGKDVVKAAAVSNPASALTYDAGHDAMMQALRIHWERIDELERSSRRDALKQAHTDIHAAEKEKRRLQKNLAWLELSAEAEAAPEEEQAEAEADRRAKATKIAELEGMVKDLRATIEAQSKQIKTLEGALSKEQETRENAEQEYDALLTMLQDYQEKQDDTEEALLDTSIFGKKKIIIVGGHPSWVLGMRTLHPNIDIFGKDMPSVTSAAITGADMIWFQVNAINHPIFYKVMALARVNNIPVKYFLRAGHRACRRQIVQDTTDYFAQQGEIT